MKTSINLLPPLARKRQVLRRRLRQWITALSIVLALGWTWHWYELKEDRALAQQLEVMEREHAPTQRLLQQLVAMRAKLEQLQSQEAVATELERQRSVLTLLGVVSKTTARTSGRLRLTKLELKDFQAAQVAGATPSAGSESGLLLTGVSLDNPSVGELLDGLQDSKIFSHVELLVLKEREDGDEALRDYEVRCMF